MTVTQLRQVVLSWSGGKDSALALAALRADPAVEVVALLTSVTARYERVSIHGVHRSLLEAQARSVGLPLHEIRLEPRSSNAAYDAAVESALAELAASHPRARTIAYGDLFLEDVRRYREDRIPALGFAVEFPIWGVPTDALARRFIEAGFVARLVCVDTTQLDARFAGRAFDEALLAELPPSVDPCGERGEFHTFVSDGPIFSEPVRYAVGDTVMREGRFAYTDLTMVERRNGGMDERELPSARP